jgi:hypothetical protein
VNALGSAAGSCSGIGSFNTPGATAAAAGGGGIGVILIDWSTDGVVSPSQVNRSNTVAAIPGQFRSISGSDSKAR